MKIDPTRGWVRLPLALLAVGLTPAGGSAQEMGFEEYEPRSTLVVDRDLRERAAFPFVDVHSHHWGAGRMTSEEVDALVADMDALNMQVAVNLSGGSGPALAAAVDALKGRYPTRFVVFANLDFDGIGEPGWTEGAVRQLEADVASGAQGLKIFKNLGLSVTDPAGNRVPVDDPRLDPIWARAGELGIPVLIHTGDPAPFWEPWDRFNERWLELEQRPNRKRSDNDPLPWEELMAEQWAVFEAHPGTTFINAHLGWLGNDLGRLDRLMDRYPNMVTELGAVLAEIGRQPRTARDFLIRRSDRVLMGKDSWAPDEYRVYFRTLETDDEYFDYYRRRHAHWKLYGLDLPEEVLRHIYWENAVRVIPGLDPGWFTGEADGGGR